MPKKYTFDSLTGLKGFFSLIIVLFHTLPSTPLIEKIPLTSFIGIYGGTLGNCFFFIASGFLLSFGYRDRICKREVSFREFLVKRLRKLYPLYLITNFVALIADVLQYGLSAINLRDIVFTVLLQKGGGLDVGHPYNGPSWFLSALLVCYIVFFFMAYHSQNTTQYCCMISFGIIWGYSILSECLTAPLAFAHHGESFFFFFTGCALAELYPLINSKIDKWLQPASVFILLGSGFLMLRYGVDIIAGDYRVAFAFLICPLVIYLGLRNKLAGGFLKSKPVQYLGKMSFSIYLWHFVIYVLYRYLYHTFSNGGSIEEPQYLLYLILMFLVSILSHKFIET